MTAKQILRKALRRLEQPGVWGQGPRGGTPGRPPGTCCVTEAIGEAALADAPECKEAMRLIYCAAGIDSRTWGSLFDWNDDPERTLGDVLKVVRLAHAIAL